MKFMKWKSLLITSLVCLLPVLLGVALWDQLPDTMAIHFNIYNEPDGFASKPFVVFGLPLLMVVLQACCCFINDWNASKHGTRVKFERVTKWIIPIMALILQPVTLFYSLGWEIDIRRVAVFIVGVILIVIGNYLPKFDQINATKVSADKARKINRFIGFETVIMGILMLISIFLPPIASIIALVLMIPYALIAIVYGIKVGTKKDEVV